MFIELNKIGPKGLLLEDSIALEENLIIEDESYFLEDTAFEVLLVRDGQKIKAKGSVRALISLKCVSCLDYYDLKINSKFDIILFPGNQMEMDRNSLNPDDMEYIFFEGDGVDLKKILMEQINLSIPINPVCNVTCKGLCPNCGKNMNYENCQCETPQYEVSFLFNKLKR
ncbi:MAG: DUF177 domain-containing protein [bacterium]|nr:DUF177 domain-containing protein [bacterium]